MTRVAIVNAVLLGAMLAGGSASSGQAQEPPGNAPRAVTVARATQIPQCTLFVDAAAAAQGNGTVQRPHKTIAAAVAAARNDAVICVAEGTYAEQLKPGEKSFVLAGGFQRGKDFKVRDSAAYVTRAAGKGGSFIRIEDPAPKANQRTAIDGFDIGGYSQAIYRDAYYTQRFDITNNHIHDNTCAEGVQGGAGFYLNNVIGSISGNVFRKNSCAYGGAGFLNETVRENNVSVERNWLDGNAGTDQGASHGGALFLGGKTLRITGNLFTNNTVTQWGAGLYISAWTEGGQFTTANLNWNVYRGNRAGNVGGGMFCDNAASCHSYHEIYDRNCGGNIYLDAGSDGSGPTTARFFHLTNVGALDVECKGPGPGVRIDRDAETTAPDTYAFIDAIFWGNAPGMDFAANCSKACGKVKIDVRYSMVQTKYLSQGLTVTFGEGIIAPADPLFANPQSGDFHLKSVAGRWTPQGYVQDAVNSPALAKGNPEGSATDNPERAGKRNELGAYGNSREASYVVAAAAPPPPPAPQPPTPPTSPPDTQPPTGSVPRAVTVARATEIPRCTLFVDAAAAAQGNGTVQRPHKTITAAVEAARNDAVICVAEGTYEEELKPGEKSIVLAGGFQSGKGFRVRDSALHVSKAIGAGGSFIRYEDPGPKGNQYSAVDGFDISGYAQAIHRDIYYSQKFDITNNHIHDNHCNDDKLAGAGFVLNNVTGEISGNVIANNTCGRGGAGYYNDEAKENTIRIERNLIDGNAGTEPGASHGGALYIFGPTLRVTGNLFVNNSVTQWGAGLYVGAWTEGGHHTKASLNWNVYRNNKAGNGGGGMFCDEGAACHSYHEVYDRNCGGNIYLDSGGDKSGPTVATFDHLTNVNALDAECKAPGPGVRVDAEPNNAPDSYSFVNALFWNNAPGVDFVASCPSTCKATTKISYSMVQTKYLDQNLKVTFGDGIVTPEDPLFADPEKGDFHLKSTAGRWTPTGYVKDDVTSPAIAKGYGGGGDNPPEAGDRNELGAYGNSREASYVAAAAAPAPAPAPPAPAPPAPTPPAPAPQSGDLNVPPTDPAKPAIARGARYMGFPERFNRYYTDPSWKPSKTVYVSPNGNGNGSSRDTPMAVRTAVAAARPGTMIYFLRGAYQGCFQFTKETSGTYDEPVVLYGERKEDQSIGVSMTCCTNGRQTCFNMEDADYVAVDGFELIGGQYGVRAIGAGYPASQHSKGIAVLNCNGHDQNRDPFFSGQADWAVWERNLGYGAKAGDGHGLYISNGSDWNIVRFNETHSNVSSDFQINADPASTCKEVGIPFNDARCDAYAGTGEGGQGASDYFLVDSNYFHHGTGNGSGANFTSVRRSIVRNNVFGFYPRHGVSFWQETDNPRLGSSDNKVVHNLFITTGRHAVQFSNHSTRNEFANNIMVGVRAGSAAANPSALLMEVDGTVGANVYRQNLYASGRVEGRSPGAQEMVRDFSAGWFAKFPSAMNRDPNDFKPAAGAPFLGIGTPSPFAPTDRNGAARSGKADLGPIVAAAAAAATTPPPQPAPPPPPPPNTQPPPPDGQLPPGSAPRAVTVARATAIPQCTVFVDAAAAGQGNGTVERPHKTIAAAVAAARNDAVICVAEGTYAEQIKPGEKSFTLAGGFQRGKSFKVRDSAAYVSKAVGKGGSFLRIEDPGPKGQQLTAIDGFEITGYSQAVVRDFYESQRFELTNNHIHGNKCADNKLAGGGAALSNITGRIEGNVFRNNSCGRGGAVFVQDPVQKNTVAIERNLVDDNHGTEPDAAHGGAVYVFGKTVRITGNLFTRNSVTQWGGGLYVGAWTEGNQFTTANLNWNIYRDNRAGNGGGGMFCDDGATCNSYHEVYVGNCGSNILLDSGTTSGPTTAKFYHLTNVGARDVGCNGPGAGVRIDRGDAAPDNYAFINALFWNNAPGVDFVATCDQNCGNVKVNVSHSMVQTKYLDQGLKISFGEGIMAPVDPLFGDPEKGDFHLKSTAGRWTPAGYVRDTVMSPAIAKGQGGGSDNPPRAGDRNELGAYGNSVEASYVR